MKVDLLVAEIGSTTTIVNAFTGIKEGRPRFLGQAAAATSIPQGDVTRGLEEARLRLARLLNQENLEAREVFATSSAAGGLSMTVHGLVPEMTVRAAREAALGSGAVLRMVSSGKLRLYDIERVRAAEPRIIMVAGGTDGGERETALFNFEKLSEAMPATPFLYAGNSDNDEEIRSMAKSRGLKLYVTENVYPSLDNLNIEPARYVIQEIFEEHIIEAPGMSRIHQAVTGPIMPTPGAVMAMAEKIYPVLGDLVALDVGGATTDVHSVTEGNEALLDFRVNPEPFAKRTVEGDLGVFVNRDHVIQAMTPDERESLPDSYRERLRAVPEIPQGPEEEALIFPLVRTCCREALDRHAGRMIELFTARGRRTVVRGRDLTAVQTLIATGGALTRLSGVVPMVKELLKVAGSERLYPPTQVRVMIDKDYLMASCGVIARTYPDAAVQLLMDSLTK
ncbi:MAG TPA: glutamate mutase L [Bacillota bacterium]|jgi:uncharacterized protein (TIGR01319 family)|nr:DNA mismatch repair protein MutL [Fastidiosipila sp.]HPX92737.1 glutamate mutase L [Bacillota bacterium]HQB80634.1 glutamate mutase L [Bacillota bacterium]